MKFALTIFTFLILLTTGCTRCPVDDTLERAEALMMSAPDSALSLLETIDSAELRGDRRKALHALLLSQAMDKNHIDTDNDSLINIAVNFYATDDDLLHRMLSYYYLGRVKNNAGEDQEVLLSYMKALELATEAGDNYWIGLISRRISNTFNKSYNCAEQLYYAEKAFEHMKLTGQHSHTCATMIIFIEALYDKGELDKGIRYAYRLLDSVRINHVSRHERAANALVGKGHLLKYEDRKAIPFLEKACIADFDATYVDSVYLSVAYTSVGKTDLARSMLNRLDADSCLEYSWLKYEIFKRTGKTREALDALILTDSLLHKKFSAILADNQSRLISELYNAERREAIDKADTNRTRMIIILLASCAALSFAVTIGVRLYRKQRREIENNVAIAEELRQILSLKENQNAKTKKAIEDMMSSRYETIDHLCSLCYEKKDDSSLKMRISEEVVSTIDNLTSQEGKLPELERNADKFHNGLMSHLRSEMPGLRKSDYLLMLFSTLGFSTPAIALLLKEDKIEAVYNRKSRLKIKIKRLNPPHATEFLNALS